MRPSHRAALGVLALCASLAAGPAGAERLSWNVYTTAHGLAGDAVRDLLVDSRGFLWIATSSGLSRFDGRIFRNYDTAAGLPGPRVESLAETADGSIWVATSEGLGRLRPDPVRGRPAFTRESIELDRGYRGSHALFVDRERSLWAAFFDRLLRIELDGSGRARPVEVAMPAGSSGITAFAEDGEGTLWIGTGTGLFRRPRGGAIERVALGDRVEGRRTPAAELVACLAFDRQGRLWAGVNGLLLAWQPAPASAGEPPLLARARRARPGGDLPRSPGEAVVWGEPEGMPSIFFNAIVPGREEIWVTTRHGLVAIDERGPRTVGPEHGLIELHQTAALEDPEGALWLGSESRGFARLGRSGFVSFDGADGLAGERAATLFESPPGELWVITSSRDLHRFDGRRFEAVTPRALFPAQVPGWGWNQYVVRDRRGRLWFPTAGGLFRFPAFRRPEELREARPERHWRAGDGLDGDDVFRAYEDRQGDVWVSTLSSEGLVRFEQGEGPVPVPEAMRHPEWGAPTAFAEDRAGALWLGYYSGGLARLAGGTWSFYGTADGLPPGFVYDLHLDRAGRLWIATGAGGVARVDDPGEARPRFRVYSTRDGLSTESTRCLTEDAAGRILVGTTRGVDRLDPATGGVRSFSREDGLPNSMVVACHAGADGALWFGTYHGLARFVPPPEEPRRPPRVWLSGLAVAGEPEPIPERGVDSIPERVLAPSQRSLRIEYLAVALGLGENLRFQHRVLGASEEWSEPTPERVVHLAALSPGRYRFEVRATTREGAVGEEVAGFDFRLLPPLWQRPWFLALVALAAGSAAIGLARLRTARLLAVERARTRIASDLHDDVGSSVSRIGLLGELARRRLREDPEGAESILGDIGREASELAEATSDIVWSIDPRRDDLRSLAVRLRRFAADLLEARGIELEFDAPADAEEVALSPEVRRALYLTLKEAIHNVAKHSGASRARVSIAAGTRELAAEVVDDGRGIDPERAAQAAAEGRHGLGGLAARAAEAGGSARVGPARGVASTCDLGAGAGLIETVP